MGKLTGQDRKVRLGLDGKVKKKGIIPMINSYNLDPPPSTGHINKLIGWIKM